MKAVLLAVQHKWCKLIMLGFKTVEVRKTKPTIETPFKSYIYYTSVKNLSLHEYGKLQFETGGRCDDQSGKVIGEFICDKIYDIDPYDDGYGVNQYINGWKADDGFDDCLTFEEKKAYLGNKKGYGWHISDLKIYDEPKELSEFWRSVKCDFAHTYCCACFAPCKWNEKGNPIQPLTRPPQSWCYVEGT